MPSPHAPRLPPVQVATDHPCATCGYNLRTMPLDGRCPECGTGVEVSLDIVGLRTVPRKALRPLYEGLRGYLACNVVLGALLLAASGDPSGAPVMLGGPGPAALLLSLKATVALKVAIWCVLILRGVAGWIILTPGEGMDFGRERLREGMALWVLIGAFGVGVFLVEDIFAMAGPLWLAALGIFGGELRAFIRVHHALAYLAGRTIDVHAERAMAMAGDLQVAFCFAAMLAALPFDGGWAYWFTILPAVAAGVVSMVVMIRLLKRLSRAVAVAALQQPPERESSEIT